MLTHLMCVNSSFFKVKRKQPESKNTQIHNRIQTSSNMLVCARSSRALPGIQYLARFNFLIQKYHLQMGILTKLIIFFMKFKYKIKLMQI